MLSKYGILYSKYLEEYKPISYQELIMNGTINNFLELKDKEFNNIRNSIIDELKNKCKNYIFTVNIRIYLFFTETENL